MVIKLFLAGIIHFLYFYQCAQGVSIVDIRFASGTGSAPNEGVIEIKSKNNKWGSVCDLKFGRLEANVMCYMMGYDGINGYNILSPPGNTNFKEFIASDMNCTSNVNPSDKENTFNVSKCDFRFGQNNIPGPPYCKPENAVRLLCGGTKRAISNQTNVESNFKHLTCTNTADIRLGGNYSARGAGRLEVRNKGSWGTVCALGFGRSDAASICKILCGRNTSETASVYINRDIYGPVDPDPVVLKKLTCPTGATEYGNCTTENWSITDTYCSNKTNVYLECSPIDFTTKVSDPKPEVKCLPKNMIEVAFNKSDFEGSNLKMFTLDGFIGPNCNVIRKETQTQYTLEFSLNDCNSTFLFSDTSIIIENMVVKSVNTTFDNVFTTVPRHYRVRCVILRSGNVTNGDLGSHDADQTISDTKAQSVDMKLYLDSLLKQEINVPATLKMKDIVYAEVSTSIPFDGVLLVVPKCWVTPTLNSSNTIETFFVDKCIEARYKETVHFQQISNSRFAFSFPVIQFADEKISVANSDKKFRQIFLHCETNLCQSDDPAKCNRFCAPTRGRRSIANEGGNILSKMKTLDMGPIYISEGSTLYSGRNSLSTLWGIVAVLVSIVTIRM